MATVEATKIHRILKLSKAAGFGCADLSISKVDENNPMPLSTLYNKNQLILAPYTKRGDRVRLTNGLVGTIRDQGEVDFSDETYLGIVLNGKHYNGHNGVINNKKYFNVKKRRGYFAKQSEVARVLTPSGAKSMKHFQHIVTLTDFPKLNDRVQTVKGKTGVVRYVVGTTSFASGILIGLELEQWWPNGHDGAVDKKRYFSCAAGRGYFTRLSHLVEELSQPQTRQLEQETSTQRIRLNLKIGIRVQLQEGLTGVVRYIGTPSFTQHEVLGIELDVWSANAGDGSVSGKRLFSTSAGRGYFTRRQRVEGIIQSKVTEGGYGRLTGLVRVPKFNGKTVTIVSYIARREKWKVQLLHGMHKNKYLGVRAEKLLPIQPRHPIADVDQNELESLQNMPSIGDRVLTRQGRFGRVKYVGPVEFASCDEQHNGIELEQWNPNGHNGAVNKKQYFHAIDGYGYFVKLSDLVDYLDIFGVRKQMESNQHCDMYLIYGYVRGLSESCKQPCVSQLIASTIMWYWFYNFKNANEWILCHGFQERYVTMHSTVRLNTKQRGKVQFVSDVHFDDRLHFGIVLSEWSINAHDGTVDGKRYFDAPVGHGLLVPISSIFQVWKDRERRY